jgi:large subunit ribosomal protein L6
MSRIGKLPVAVPPGVSVKWEPPLLKVKGPKGELAVEVKAPASITVEGNIVRVTRPDDERLAKSRQGLCRSLINNAVHGVSQGYERKLEIVGVGYKAEVAGKILKLTLGFAFPKEFPIADGVTIKVEKDTIVVSGIDRQQVGDVAARIRRHRPPEPYKGKGVRYAGEHIRRKAGKAAAGGKK